MDSEQNTIDNTFQQGVEDVPSAAFNSGELPPETSLPVGIFYVNLAKNKVQLNTHLAHMLGVPTKDAGSLSYQVFIQRLFSNTDNPGITGADYIKNILDINENPSLVISLKDFPDKSFKIFLYDDPVISGTDNFGGLLVDLSADQRILKKQMRVLVDLCHQSRKISAAAAGNLQALTGNIKTWNDKLVEEFLLDTGGQIISLNEKLDLVLNFINILYDRSLFPETINLWQLLREIVQKYPDLDLYVKDSTSPEKPFIPVHVDPVITKLALEYFLDEITKHVQSDHPVDVVIAIEEQHVKVNLQSSRTLPLPGFSSETDDDPQSPVIPTVMLAKNIIISQGGTVRVKRHPADQGTGISVNIDLPLHKDLESGRISHKSLPEKEDRQGSGRVLLAESQSEYQLSIQESLSKEGYRVDLAIEGNTALDMVQRINPVAVLVANNLQGMNGIILTKGIRRWSAVPIIMLSASSRPDDLVQAFQAGVDDYLIKPFLIEELILRLRSIIRRSEGSAQATIPDIYYSGDIRIDYSSGQVWRKGNPVHLTPIEYNLLVYMTRQGKQIMTYDQLLERVWEGPEKGSRQGLFVHVRRLREKIETDPKKPRIILNKWGVGYEFNP